MTGQWSFLILSGRNVCWEVVKYHYLFRRERQSTRLLGARRYRKRKGDQKFTGAQG